MTAVTITRASVTGLPICDEGIEIARAVLPARRRLTFAQVRDAGMSFDDLVCIAAAMARRDKDVLRRLQMWRADCAARVVGVYDKLETSDAPRNAIIAVRRYERGEIDAAGRDAARDAGRDAARATARLCIISGASTGHWAASWASAWTQLWGAGWIAA